MSITADSLPDDAKRLDFMGFPKYAVDTAEGSVWTLHGKKPRRLKPCEQGGFQHVTLQHEKRVKTFKVHILVRAALLGLAPDAGSGESLPPDSRRLDFLGFEDYAVDRAGNVWHWRSLQWSKLRTEGSRESSPYAHVFLCEGRKKRKQIRVHLLVLQAFVGPCPPGMEARHLNDDGYDNRLENLAWGTHLENVADRDRDGVATRGERHPGAKLKDADIPRIIAAAANGETHASIARRLGVGPVTITRIINGQRWKHAQNPS